VTAPPGIYTPYDITQLPPPLNVTIGGGGTPAQIVTGVGLILCISAGNTSTTALARWLLYDGTDTTGQLLACLSGAAGATVNVTPCPPGIPFNRGVFVNRPVGGFSAVMTYIPLQQPLA